MSSLKILEYPHKSLRTATEPVIVFDENLKHQIKEMFALMYQEDGVGLAATQVGLPLRLFVSDCSRDQSQPICFINPEIIRQEGIADSDEGCLSFPGVYAKIPRAPVITVRYQNENGESVTLEAQGLLAFCIQHELEHLDGKVFIDNLSKLKRDRLLKKLHKTQRLAG